MNEVRRCLRLRSMAIPYAAVVVGKFFILAIFLAPLLVFGLQQEYESVASVISGGMLAATYYSALKDICKNVRIFFSYECKKESRRNCTDGKPQNLDSDFCCQHQCKQQKENWLCNKLGECFNKCSCLKTRYCILWKSKLSVAIHLILLISATVLTLAVQSKENTHQIKRGTSGTTINIYGNGMAVVDNNASDIKLWSAADIAVPAEENNVMFLTKKRVKRHQTQGKCGESNRIAEAKCSSRNDCKSGKMYRMGHGMTTGECANGTCQVYAWCPINYLEDQEGVTVEELIGLGEYSVLFNTRVFFNFEDAASKSYSTLDDSIGCSTTEPDKAHCPLYSVNYMVQQAMRSDNVDFLTERSAISVKLKLNCDFSETACVPRYKFTFFKDYNMTSYSNYSYTAITYPYGNENDRIYLEATGILFIVEVDAVMARYSILKSLTSAAAAYTVIKSTEGLAEAVTFILICLFGVFSCYCCCCCKDKRFQKCAGDHRKLDENGYTSLASSQENSENS